MFKKIKELQSLVDESRKALKEAERKIEKLLQEQDYNNTENLKNKIRTILNKKELVDLLKSN